MPGLGEAVYGIIPKIGDISGLIVTPPVRPGISREAVYVVLVARARLSKPQEFERRQNKRFHMV